MNAYMIAVYVVCSAYMILNFKHDIQMFQQNSYRIPRYWRWLRHNMANTWRLTDIVCILLMCAVLLDYRMAAFLVALVCLAKTGLIFKKKYKKPLVFTRRVWRLYTTTAVISVGAVTAVAVYTGDPSTVYWGTYPAGAITVSTILLLAVLSFIPLIIADIILIPVEKWINRRYINDARRILRSMPDLTVVGITGSYGKTSTKHYLTRILSEEYDTLMTPGSYNTPMGVVRTIREMMKPYNQIFVCEMGAKQKGDIKEICDIVHPRIGIVTAVGPMHLESFKTLDNVCSTKFELVDALPSDGVAMINNDFDQCANREVSNVKAVRYGVTNTEHCGYRAVNVRYTPDGTTFTVEGPEGFSLDIATRLLGECNVSDLLAAIVTALHLGVAPEKIRYAVGAIEQVEHRLSIKRTPGNVTIIDDAFNSNPSGSKMAVDVLSRFDGAGKRIIVTPGMIELGSEQYNLNREFGRHIAGNVDIAIVVGAYNRDAITEGIREGGFNEKSLIMVDSFNEAQQRLAGLLSAGDTVLYENDLPDTFK